MAAHSSDLAAAHDELAAFPPWPESGRLEIIPTTACPFRCRYCGVRLGERQAAPEILDRGVDLLLASRRPLLELQFFGGEPLLRRREVLRCMRRGAKLAAARGKQLRFVITTSGLLLDAEWLAALKSFDAKVMFSIDGPADVMARYRPLAKPGSDPSATLEGNLQLLARSGVDYFVNLVVTPEGAEDVPRRVRHLASLGARTIQICYALTPGWSDAAQVAHGESLRACAELAAGGDGPSFRLQNLGSAAEPTVLSNDIIMDVDGTLYDDIALFGEAVLPGLRPVLRLGHVTELTSLDGLRPSREQNLVALRQAFPDEGAPERRIVEEQLALARRVQGVLGELEGPAAQRPPRLASPAARQPDHNPLQERVLRRSLRHQARVMERQPELLALPMLMLANPCSLDCLFCLPKPLPPTPLSEVTAWLDDNLQLGLTRLGLGGNEPLGHPQIDAIIDHARARGFTRFDVLSSGVLLRDPGRARHLVELGVVGFGLPLHGAEAAVHDAITQRPGSYADTVQAIETLVGLGAEVHVHANLVRHNLGSLRALEQQVTEDWGLPFCVIPIRPKSANRPYLELQPRYSEIAAQVAVSCLVGFPLCVARQVQDRVIPSGAILSDLLKVYVLDQPFVKPSKCRGCGFYGRCSGTFAAYLDHHGDAELVPLEPAI